MNFHSTSLSVTFEGENTVWTQLQTALGDLDGDTLYRLPTVNGDNRFMFEFDIVVAPRGQMPVVIECKVIAYLTSLASMVWSRPWGHLTAERQKADDHASRSRDPI